MQLPVVATRGLNNDELDARPVEQFTQPTTAAGVVPELPCLARRGDVDIDVFLTDIDSCNYFFLVHV